MAYAIRDMGTRKHPHALLLNTREIRHLRDALSAALGYRQITGQKLLAVLALFHEVDGYVQDVCPGPQPRNKEVSDEHGGLVG